MCSMHGLSKLLKYHDFSMIDILQFSLNSEFIELTEVFPVNYMYIVSPDISKLVIGSWLSFLQKEKFNSLLAPDKFLDELVKLTLTTLFVLMSLLAFNTSVWSAKLVVPYWPCMFPFSATNLQTFWEFSETNLLICLPCWYYSLLVCCIVPIHFLPLFHIYRSWKTPRPLFAKWAL